MRVDAAYHRVILNKTESELGNLVPEGKSFCSIFSALMYELGFEPRKALG